LIWPDVASAYIGGPHQRHCQRAGIIGSISLNALAVPVCACAGGFGGLQLQVPPNPNYRHRGQNPGLFDLLHGSTTAAAVNVLQIFCNISSSRFQSDVREPNFSFRNSFSFLDTAAQDVLGGSVGGHPLDSGNFSSDIPAPLLVLAKG